MRAIRCSLCGKESQARWGLILAREPMRAEFCSDDCLRAGIELAISAANKREEIVGQRSN